VGSNPTRGTDLEGEFAVTAGLPVKTAPLNVGGHRGRKSHLAAAQRNTMTTSAALKARAAEVSRGVIVDDVQDFRDGAVGELRLGDVQLFGLTGGELGVAGLGLLRGCAM
jgi:hypothetical protein